MKAYIIDLTNNNNCDILLDYYNDLDYYSTMVAELRKLKMRMDANFVGYDNSYIDKITDEYVKLYEETKEEFEILKGLLEK